MLSAGLIFHQITRKRYDSFDETLHAHLMLADSSWSSCPFFILNISGVVSSWRCNISFFFLFAWQRCNKRTDVSGVVCVLQVLLLTPPCLLDLAGLTLTLGTWYIFMRESSYCFQRVLAIAILSLCLSVRPSVLSLIHI